MTMALPVVAHLCQAMAGVPHSLCPLGPRLSVWGQALLLCQSDQIPRWETVNISTPPKRLSQNTRPPALHASPGTRIACPQNPPLWGLTTRPVKRRVLPSVRASWRSSGSPGGRLAAMVTKDGRNLPSPVWQGYGGVRSAVDAWLVATKLLHVTLKQSTFHSGSLNAPLPCFHPSRLRIWEYRLDTLHSTSPVSTSWRGALLATMACGKTRYIPGSQSNMGYSRKV